tara:strand:- start:387 stop:839 length:453 start_codon:yes stop_codon:yes gene_type:complete
MTKKEGKDKMDRLKMTACNIFEIEPKDFKSRNRARHLIDIRRMVYFISRDLLELPWTHIGKKFDVDHATIMHHYKAHKGLVEVDKGYSHKYHTLLEMFKADIDYVDMQEMLDIIKSLKTKTAKKIVLKELMRQNNESEGKSEEFVDEQSI